MSSQSVAFLGLGNMGLPMALNIAKAGFQVTLWNRSVEKAEAAQKEAAAEGLSVTVAESLEAAVDGKHFIITMVANDEALENVLKAMLSHCKKGAIHLSMSTISPSCAKACAAKCAEFAVRYLASPVFGRPEHAKAKQLSIPVTGDERAFEESKPLLESLGHRVTYFGETLHGANAVKLCGNFLLLTMIESWSEALALGEANGLDREKLTEFLSGSLFPCPVVQNYSRMIAARDHFPAGFVARLGLKDASLIHALGAESEVPLPMASLLKDRIQTMLNSCMDNLDWSALGLLASRDAGVDIQKWLHKS
uniref:6-phosphogluconate dehydrogenase NADP-binding domain-containing protein n=1 Tax=Chromera velia CCMP2878 TaxID=1169474 RepID=A0A0G4I949_9ALVE|eukprot:Cvel_12162.t1-p1 / transcript=Cvel_12162.t1 / gene=Cvel_12162 / organism=Chromera_velia_CCMP2878 / gene_product=Uncharacterized oxidoreductase YfjR, putative / transcript_product=Uncharacterized oxidoreductase YfjR, putative / location=Cvel_scaffold784:55310-56582(-) / protein_length=307 / sequence_SO=supercontig / SO=protein_coding / is_pseudo=false